MGMLERLSDARGTLEGKIVAVVLAILLVLPVATVTAFAGDQDDESAETETEQTQAAEPATVEEIADKGSNPVTTTKATETPEVPQTPVVETPTTPEGSTPEESEVPAVADPADSPEKEEPEATTIEISLKIDKGATLKFEDTFYTEDDTKLELTSDQENEFTIELDEGYELAVEKPVVFKDVKDTEEELEAVDGKYTFPKNVMDGGMLTVTANTSLTATPEEDAIAPVAEKDDGWVVPASPQSIAADYYCTSRQLGANVFSTDSVTNLGGSEGVDPAKIAPKSTEQGDLEFYFHHAQIIDLTGKNISGEELGKRINESYNVDNAISSIRFNQSANNGAGAWECKTKANPSWTAFVLSERVKLIFFYNQQVGLDGNVTANTRDWPWSENEWVAGKYTTYDVKTGQNKTEDIPNYPLTYPNNFVDSTLAGKKYWAGCVVYQLYDSADNRLGNQIRTYYYSPNADKEGVSLAIAEHWGIDEICVSAVGQNTHFVTRKAYEGVKSPDTFEQLVSEKTVGYTTSDTDNFTIPFLSEGKRAYNVWLVGVKVRALPSKASLSVEYLDADITDHDVRIHDPESVPANKPNGTPDPTWNDYVSFDGDKLAGDPDSVEIVTNISNSATQTVPFRIDVEGYASKPVRAVLDGNTLKLYYNRMYDVSYVWSGLDETGVKIFRDQDGNQTWELPGTSTVVVNDTVDVDSSHKAGDLAYALNDNKQVLAIYKFSGWKLDGQGDVVTGKITVNSDKHFVGVWTRLDTAFSGTVDITGAKYDGTDAYAESLWSSLENTLSKTTMNEDASYEYFVALAKDENGKVTEWKPLENAPVNAGSYKVVATWPQTAEHFVVKAEKPFEITKRSIAITGVSGSWLFDGKEHSTMDKNGSYNDEGAIDSLAGDGFVANEGVNVEYSAKILAGDQIENPFTYSFWGNTSPDNYIISTTAGKLEITNREDAAKTHIVMTAKSSGVVQYTGTMHDFSGLASVAGADGSITNGTVAPNGESATFIYESNTYTISNFTTTGERNAKDANLPLPNAEGQYDTYKNDIVAIAPENGEASQAKIKITLGDVNGTDVTNHFVIDKRQGTAQILPRPVVLQAKNASKVYDGSNFVLSDEQKVVTNKMGEPFDSVLDSEAVVTSSLDGKEYKNATTYTEAIVVDETSIVSKKDVNGDALYKQTNYDIQFNPGTLTITPQSINRDDTNAYKGIQVGYLENVQYNGTKWVKTPEVTPAAGSVNEAITFDVTRTDDLTNVGEKAVDLTNVGTKTVTITGTGNYTGTVTRTFDVTKAPMVIMVNSASKVYGAPDPAFTGTAGVPTKGDDGNWKRTEEGAYVIDSLFQNDRNNNATDYEGDFAYFRKNADVNDARTYPGVLNMVEDTKANLNSNYELIEVVPGNFSITQATATLNATGVTTTYDANEYGITVDSLGAGWTVEYATTPNGPWGENPVYTEAGQYPVYVKATNPNYVDVYGTATVTINPAPVVIRVNDATKVAGSDNPEFTGAIEGEVAGHELTGVSYYRKGNAEGIGTYENDLTASFDDNPNYTITVEDGDFTITAMPIPAEPVMPPTPPAPGPLDGIVTTITDFLATPIIGPGAVATEGVAGAEGIADTENPLAQIEDDGTPMGAFDHPICWVHYYILLGIIITAIYGGGVIARRLGYNHTIKKYEDDVTGKGEKSEPLKKPVAKEGMQPTI